MKTSIGFALIQQTLIISQWSPFSAPALFNIRLFLNVSMSLKMVRLVTLNCLASWRVVTRLLFPIASATSCNHWSMTLSVTFTSQCQLLSDPIRFNKPFSLRLFICHSAPLRVNFNFFWSSAIVMVGFTLIVSSINPSVFSTVFRPKTETINPSEIFWNMGAGNPYFIQCSMIRLIPDPYFYTRPRLLKTSAISLFRGVDL